MNATPIARPGALAGVRVLDLSRVLAGPWSSQLLADLGADVIKVERPGVGDDTRRWGPPWFHLSEDPASTPESAYFACANRNKRSVAIDLGAPDGQETVRQLAREADVLIENFKVGDLKRYGLDHEALQQVNPRLVYCSITGFGQTGPLASLPGYDFLIQAMGGLMSVTGRGEGEPGAGPMKVGVALVDILTGLYACVAILAALAHRSAGGSGQHIDLALLDVQVACLANQASNFLASGDAPRRMGNAHPNIVPYQDFPARDGHIIITVGNDAQFGKLCRTLGSAEWAEDTRYASNAQRVANRAELVALIASRTRLRPVAFWVEALADAGVPCGPINSVAQAFEHPQVVHRGMRVDAAASTGSSVPLVANPIRMSQTPVCYRRAPPALGAHTDEVLREWLRRP